MKILENNIERDATPEEETFFQEQIEQIAELPTSLDEEFEELKQQQLDIAEAVISLYETMAIGVGA